MEQVSLQEFYDQLNRHDWYFDFSDDICVCRKGREETARLTGIANQSPEHKALMDAFRDHYFSGESWGTEKKPKPERPA